MNKILLRSVRYLGKSTLLYVEMLHANYFFSPYHDFFTVEFYFYLDFINDLHPVFILIICF